MNKSTPLSHLPSQPMPSPSPAMPVHTEPKTSEMLGEDDATIQEVLNQINMQHQPSTQTLPPPPQISLPQVMPTAPPHQSPHDLYGMMQQQSQVPMGATMISPVAAPMVIPPSQNNTVDMFFSLFMDDIKLALLVLVVVIVAHFIPISSFLNKYIAIDKIPYHDIILRGIMCAICIVAAKKLLFV